MNQPAVITVLLHDFQLGGSERVAIRLANAWCRLGYRVIIYAGSDLGVQRSLVSRAVEVMVARPSIPRKWFGPIRLAWWAARRSAQDRPDVCFLPGNSYFTAAWPLWLASGCTARLFAKISNPLWRPDRTWLRNVIFRVLVRAYLSPVSGIAAMSHSLQRAERDSLPRHHAVLFDALFDDLPRITDHARRSCHFCAVGRLTSQKNFALLLRALALLGDLPFTLTIVGGGEQLNELRQLSSTLGIADRVDFAGEASDSGPYLAEADALILSSDFEGYPAVVVEALAAGAFVIARNCTPALAEILQPATGTIVEGNDPKDLAAAIRGFVHQRRTAGSSQPQTADVDVLTAHVSDCSAREYLRFFKLAADAGKASLTSHH